MKAVLNNKGGQSLIGILGVGHYLPTTVMTNDDWAGLIDTSDEWIFSRTGIKERRFVQKGEGNLDVSLIAAKNAMRNAHVTPDEIGLVVCATLSADHICPSLACEIIAALDIECPAFDISAACSGFIYAITTAQALLPPGKKALVVASELMTRLFDPTDRASCVLFGDGAGAAVIGEVAENSTRAILATHIEAYPDKKLSLMIDGINHKENGELVESFVEMNGAEVYRFATRIIPKEITTVLDEIDLQPQDVKIFIPHQANIRIIETAAKLLNLPMDRFYMNIDHTGNTSGASIAIALSEYEQSGQLHSGDIVVLNVFGGGFTSGTVVLRW